MKGCRVRYTLATKLVNELVEAGDEKQLNKASARHGRVDLLCTDELGYRELDGHGAELLFQVLTGGRRRTAWPSPPTSRSAAGPRSSPTSRLCAAIVDRFTFNGTILETGTDSYRLASTRARAETPVQAG